jgi:hypothetical protein
MNLYEFKRKNISAVIHRHLYFPTWGSTPKLNDPG